MEILRVTLVNNQPRVWCLGDTDLIPGQKRRVAKEFLDHPDVKDGLEKGYLKLVEEPIEETQETTNIDGMTVDQLKAYAAEKGVDLGGATLKADILAAIKGHE
ncbi:hypothetical protein [Anaeroarcus burkinensis]|uniref:hypothetical protein n=1 Tax=Anaeroarcus burkinensis TaxID=82376 RepID=UPI000419D3AE|nr:hypothetical protein [Anaeroarcus burkinensis]